MSSARGFYRLTIIAALVFSLTAVSAARTRSAKHTSKSHKVTSTTKSQTSKSARTKSTRTAKSSSKSRTSKSLRASKSSRSKIGKTVARRSGPRGQQEIASERTREIQTALIRERYLDGEPSGVMDQDTRSALMKFQSDNGWQTKIVPDARALIKLGLGPSREGLLNPDSAALATPATLSPEKEIPGGR